MSGGKRGRTYGVSNPLPSGLVPQDEKEALTGEDKEHWRKSMFGETGEQANHERMKTMRPILRRKVPRGRKLIRAKMGVCDQERCRREFGEV